MKAPNILSGTSLRPRHRQLTAAEIRLLHAKASSLQRRGLRGLSAGLWVAIAAIAILWALTMLASDSPAIVITAFWLVVGTVIVLWVRKDFHADRKTLDGIADRLTSAIRRNSADVYDIRASGFVQFDEIEDEGACYAFQLEHQNKIIFLSGQEFYEEARFPSLDFSLVCPLDEAGDHADMLIEKRGMKTSPDRRISANVKLTLELPDDLEIIAGTLDDIEDILRSRRARR